MSVLVPIQRGTARRLGLRQSRRDPGAMAQFRTALEYAERDMVGTVWSCHCEGCLREKSWLKTGQLPPKRWVSFQEERCADCGYTRAAHDGITGDGTWKLACPTFNAAL